MGSPDPEYGRQLNGMGGGISSLSKICVVGPPTTEQAKQGVHVQYTFVQVGIDYSGNCGNLSSMIGVFGVDEGLCKPQIKEGLMTVRSFNTNTQKVMDTTFPVTHNGVPLLNLPQTNVAGVSGIGSRTERTWVGRDLICAGTVWSGRRYLFHLRRHLLIGDQPDLARRVRPLYLCSCLMTASCAGGSYIGVLSLAFAFVVDLEHTERVGPKRESASI